MTNEQAKPSETSPAEHQTTQPATTRPRALGFSDLRDEMDRLWETVMNASWRPFQGVTKMPSLTPMDVFEKDGKLHVHAELPGMNEKDIEVEVANGVLTISGEKKDAREVKEGNFYRSERTYGSFRREVTLPQGADTDNVVANFKDGVLELEVPLKAAADKKKIEVKTSS